MFNFYKDKSEYNPVTEFERIKNQLICAENEFENAVDKTHIKAAIFRLCELEARRDMVLNKIRRSEQ